MINHHDRGVRPNESANRRSSKHPAHSQPKRASARPWSAERLSRWGMTSPAPLVRCEGSGLTRDQAELAQRSRLILDVSSADLEAAEAAFGAFHPTTSHFRDALNEARRAWEQMRAELGTKVVNAALSQPPMTTLMLGEESSGSPRFVLVLIDGNTYLTEQVPGTELAPIQWRLNRLIPPLEDGPYYLCRLANRSTQCIRRLDFPDRRNPSRSYGPLQTPGRTRLPWLDLTQSTHLWENHP